MKSFRYNCLWMCLLLCLAACTSTPTTLPPTTTEVIPTPTDALPTATTEALAPTATPQPTTSGVTVNFGGITFVIPEGLATGISGEIVPPADEPEPPYWAVHPAYTEITLTGYQRASTFHYPRVAVYPVAEYIAIHPEVEQTVATLQSLIADPTLDLPTLPMIPIWNAAQMLYVQVAPVSFEGGRGVRYLAQYGQAVQPINNQELFYTFQGLTNDSAYYVVAVLPVSHPSLPADFHLSLAEYTAFEQQFEPYLQDLTLALNAETPDSFSPGLHTLDALVQTITLVAPLR